MVKKVAIVGAGPSGLLLAHYLLRRHHQYQIDIYERRHDPQTIPFDKSRTFPISLGARGMNALRQIPEIEAAIKAVSLEFNGTVLHQKNGKTQVISRKKPLITLDRNHLAIVLLEQLLEKYDNNRINIHFNCECTEVNVTSKQVKFQQTISSDNQKEFTANYDLLVGADGARSVVREAFLGKDNFQFEQNYIPNAYKSIFLPNPDHIPGIDLQKQKVHSWRMSGGVSILMLHQIDGNMNGVILFPYAKNPIEQLKTAEEVQKFFQDNFPTIGKLMPKSEAEEFAQKPTSRVLTVRCNRYHLEDSVLLIGDAAHAVSPSIGQGCNSALEDVLIFDKILDEYADNLAQSLKEYSLRRQPDAFALRELSDYSFPTSKQLFTEFIIRNTLAKLLHQIFPKAFLPPIFEAVFAEDISYREILHKYQGWISKVKKTNDQFFSNVENI